MSNKKNKIQLRDMSISVRNEMDLYWEDSNWWYEDDFGYDGCDCPSCRPFDSHDYEYLPEEESEYVLISRRNRVFSHMSSWSQSRCRGGMIDMKSIYSREKLREKKIDDILGISEFYDRKPTIGDLVNGSKI